MWMVRKCSEVEWKEGHGKKWVHYLVYSMLIFLLIVIVFAFIVCSVSFIVCVMCFVWGWCVICVLCLLL
jgi:hypothetical protein